MTGSPKVHYRVVDTDSTATDTLRVEKRVYRTPRSRRSFDIEHIISDVQGQIQNALHREEGNIRVRVRTIDGDEDEGLHHESSGTLFEATVTKRDIDAFSRGKIDQQTFQDRITFREHKPTPDRDKKIDIMADILSSALKQDSGHHILGHTKSTGIYQKEVGAIFLLSHHTTRSWTNDENETDPLGALKTTIIETLADYGATLRDLSPDESIIVHANLKGDGDLEHIVHIVRINRKDKTTDMSKPTKRPNRLLFRVSKRDVDAYANNKMNLEAFRKKVEITEM